jgi:hypothetical protein
MRRSHTRAKFSIIQQVRVLELLLAYSVESTMDQGIGTTMRQSARREVVTKTGVVLHRYDLVAFFSRD